MKINKAPIIGCLFFCFFSTSYASSSQLPPGRYDLIISNNIDSPFPALNNFDMSLSSQGIGPDYTVEVKRYPIIPMKVIVDFYNKLVLNDKLTSMNGFFEEFSSSMRSYAAYGDVDCNREKNNIIEASNLSQALGINWVRPSSERVPPGKNAFTQYLSWLPGNYYIGPANRSDITPAEKIDERAIYIIGRSDWELINDVYVLMNTYIKTSNESVLKDINDGLVSISNGSYDAYKLAAGNWLYKNGKYTINTEVMLKDKKTTLTSNQVMSNCDMAEPTFDTNKKSYISLILNNLSSE